MYITFSYRGLCRYDMVKGNRIVSDVPVGSKITKSGNFVLEGQSQIEVMKNLGSILNVVDTRKLIFIKFDKESDGVLCGKKQSFKKLYKKLKNIFERSVKNGKRKKCSIRS